MDYEITDTSVEVNGIVCEVINTDKAFVFRLRKGQKVTDWCSYGMFCYLEGYVAAAQYYLPDSRAYRPILADEFCKLTASGWDA